MGNVIGYLTYDGKDLRDFGVVASSIGTHNAPQRSVEDVVVAGRNGTLTIDMGRFENIMISYVAMILDDFAERFDEFKAFMMSRRGYKRLEDTFNPSYYRLAKLHEVIEPEATLMDKAGKFEIPFDCDPRRFLKSGDEAITLTANSVIYNPTYYDAKPLLRVVGTGTIMIGTKAVTITENSTYVYIDLETMSAYNGNTNMNQYVSIADGTVLASGDNTITLANTITSVDITPRWWPI